MDLRRVLEFLLSLHVLSEKDVTTGCISIKFNVSWDAYQILRIWDYYRKNLVDSDCLRCIWKEAFILISGK